MRRYKNWAHKISSWKYLMTCPASFSWAQSDSFLLSTLNPFQGMLKVSSRSSTWFNPCRGRWIPGTGEPGGLLSMGSHRVGHNWSDLTAAAAEENINLEHNTDKVHRLILSRGVMISDPHFRKISPAIWGQQPPPKRQLFNLTVIV